MNYFGFLNSSLTILCSEGDLLWRNYNESVLKKISGRYNVQN